MLLGDIRCRCYQLKRTSDLASLGTRTVLTYPLRAASRQEKLRPRSDSCSNNTIWLPKNTILINARSASFAVPLSALAFWLTKL